MAKQVAYVVRAQKDGWIVQKEGKKTAESFHRKKEVAVKKGRTLAKRAKGILKIKTKSGRIQAKRDYNR